MEDTTSATQLDASRRRHEFSKLLSLLLHKRKVEETEHSSDDSVEASASCDSSLNDGSDQELPATAHGAIDDDTDCDVCSVTRSVINSETNETDSNHEVDETLHDYNLFEPKMRDSAARQMVEEIPFGGSASLYDAWFEECGYSEDYMLEEDKDSSSQSHTSVTNLEDDAHESSMHKINHHHSEENSMKLDETLHPCLFETEVDRNNVYDKWFLDLVTWERNRLMWLDEVGEREGFDSSGLEDRTFLVKVGDEKADGEVTCTIESDCKTPILNDNDSNDLDYWEACYRLERLQQDKYLHELGLPNWFDDLLERQNCAGVEVLKSCVDNKEGLIETKSNLERVKTEVPNEVALVYQFTDRNLWRKYHSCFKKGKFYT